MKTSKALELKHHKEFHKLNLTKLDLKVRNIFMMLCFELMEQQEEEITYTLKQLLEASGIKKNLSKQAKIDFVIGAFESLNKIALFQQSNKRITFINLFSKLDYFIDTEEAIFSINNKFLHLLNDVQKPFTVQKLIEYKSLKSGYSQLMYSLLKEWEGTKEKEWNFEELKVLLGVPITYKTTDFNKQVLTPISKELTPLFKNLKITKDNKGTKKTQSIKFTWGTKKEPIQKIDKTIKPIITKTQAELLEEIKANEKAKTKIKETEEYTLKLEEERANITNEDRKKGLEKAKEEFEKVLKNKNIPIETPIKIYSLEELNQDLLLTKSKKRLSGSALENRLKKISKDMKISIKYIDKIIKEY